MNLFRTFLVELRPYIDPTSKIAFSIGKIDIAWYAIIILAGAIIGTLYGYYRYGKPLGLTSDTVFTGLVLGLLIGVIGARLYYVIFTASTGEIKYHNFIDIINPRHGGLAIHGGIIAASIFLVIYCKLKHIKLLPLLEIAMPLILFAQVVGRWGNFMNQEAFGGLVKVAGLDEALKSGSPLSDEILQAQRTALSHLLVPSFVINRMYITSSSASGFICAGYYYPTFYFESLANLIGIIIYMIVRKYWRKIIIGDGVSFYLIWYGIVRFLIETMRTDPLMIGSTGIKMAELISVIMIIAGIAFIIIRRIKKNNSISCKDFLYSGNYSLIKDGYKTQKEPFIFQKWCDVLKKLFKKDQKENQPQEDSSSDAKPSNTNPQDKDQ